MYQCFDSNLTNKYYFPPNSVPPKFFFFFNFLFLFHAWIKGSGVILGCIRRSNTRSTWKHSWSSAAAEALFSFHASFLSLDNNIIIWVVISIEFFRVLSKLIMYQNVLYDDTYYQYNINYIIHIKYDTFDIMIFVKFPNRFYLSRIFRL